MNDMLLIILVAIAAGAAVCAATVAMIIITRMRDLANLASRQYSVIVKMQTLLKNKSATNVVAENAEMVYQDLLQCLIPTMAAIDVMPRATSEHPLWRALGGILDEYSKNPFALEKLRRAIKLNPDVARSVDNYISRADKLLNHLTATEPDGILAATFRDGLLGQSLAFFVQARQLAAQSGEM